MNNFRIKSIYQDSNGRYTIVAMSEDNDTFSLNVADKGDFEVGNVVEIIHEQASASRSPWRKPQNRGSLSAGSTDETPRQHSDSFSSSRDLA